eukprot:COSAG02_NODE_44589_length_365_cov_0.390977_2_plen_52_part_01
MIELFKPDLSVEIEALAPQRPQRVFIGVRGSTHRGANSGAAPAVQPDAEHFV